MQKIVSKYALAAHLAITAVAPLLLLPLVGNSATATVMLWLSAFGFIWVLMEPSRRRWEMPHDARVRVGRAVFSDPVFWLSVVLVVYSGLRALNGGIALVYDAELMVWSMHQPIMTLLPGCVDVTGYFCFASVLSLAVVLQGVRHALGRSARAAFVLVASVFSAMSAIVFAFAVSYHLPSVTAVATCSNLEASYFGAAFGVQVLCGVVAMFDTVEGKWLRVEPLAAFALVGNAIGLVLFAPPMTIAVFSAAFLVLVIISFVCARGAFEGSGSFRFALTIVMAIAAPVMYLLATDNLPCMSGKMRALQNFALLPDGFDAMRDSLSAVSLRAWKENPWLGTGLGSFSLDLRFFATSADWSVISPAQKSALNGWWQLLVERGVIGAGLIAVTLGMLLWTYFSRLIRSLRFVHFSAEHAVGIVSLLALTALAFVDCSFLRPEVLVLAGTFLAFSGGAFPAPIKEDSQGKEN